MSFEILLSLGISIIIFCIIIVIRKLEALEKSIRSDRAYEANRLNEFLLQVGNKVTPFEETTVANSATPQRAKRSEETKRKQSEAAKARWAERKGKMETPPPALDLNSDGVV